VASLGILAGAALERWNYVSAGNESARRPREYLDFTREPREFAHPRPVDAQAQQRSRAERAAHEAAEAMP
jgi:hypothetical protein